MSTSDKQLQREQFARAFAEWERRYREHPDQFMTDMQRAAEGCETLGQQQANYFIQLLVPLEPREAERLFLLRFHELTAK